jgi:hypothetical protein
MILEKEEKIHIGLVRFLELQELYVNMDKKSEFFFNKEVFYPKFSDL